MAVVGSSQGGILAIALAAAGEPLDAVIAHNVLHPALSDTVQVTRFPSWLTPAYRTGIWALRVVAWLLPRVPVPFDAYLDMERVTGDPANAEHFYTDPLGLRAYPLAFMASLLSADLSGMTDGSIRCPVVVVAGRGDPLFPLDYTRQVYGRIVAPSKELLVVDSAVHLLFNEDLDAVLPPLLDRLGRLRADANAPNATTATADGSGKARRHG